MCDAPTTAVSNDATSFQLNAVDLHVFVARRLPNYSTELDRRIVSSNPSTSQINPKLARHRGRMSPEHVTGHLSSGVAVLLPVHQGQNDKTAL